MKKGGRRGGCGGFTLVELLAALGIGAATALALAGLVWGVGRLAEGQSGRERVWRAERALQRMGQDLACAWAAPVEEGESAFSAGVSAEAGEAEGRVEFWRPEERAVWSEMYGVRRVAWEWRKAGKGRRVLERKEWRSAGAGTNEPVREVVLEGDFSMRMRFRTAPERPAAEEEGKPAGMPKAGEWVEGTWPAEDSSASGSGEGAGDGGKDGKKANPLPGWVRVEWEGWGERRVVDTVVQAAHFVPSMRGGVERRDEGTGRGGTIELEGVNGTEGGEGASDD